MATFKVKMLINEGICRWEISNAMHGNIKTHIVSAFGVLVVYPHNFL